MARPKRAVTQTRECAELHEGACAGEDGFYCAVYWHIVKSLPRLRALTFAARKALLFECEEYSLRYPLHLMGPKPAYLCPHYDREEKLTGAHVIALMVAGLWCQVGENPNVGGALFDGWPQLREAVAFEAAGQPGALARLRLFQPSLF